MPRHRGAVVQAVRADDRCAVLVSLFVSFSLDPMLSAYWPDPQLEAHERRNPIARALDRFNQWFDRQADAVQARDRVGARPPLADDRPRGRVVRRRDRAARSRSAAFALRAGHATDASSTSPSRRRRARISTTRRSRRRRSRGRSRARTRGRVHVHDGRQQRSGSGAVDDADDLRAARRRSTSARSARTHLGADPARANCARRRRDGVHVPAGGFGGASEAAAAPAAGSRRTDVLDRLAERIARVGARDVPGAVDVGLSTRGQKPELNVHVNRGLAGTLGVSVAQLAPSLRSRSPASTRALGRPERARRATCTCGSSPRRARTPPTSAQLPVLVDAAHGRRHGGVPQCRSARPGRGRSRRDSGRRRSTTSTASAS